MHRREAYQVLCEITNVALMLVISDQTRLEICNTSIALDSGWEVLTSRPVVMENMTIRMIIVPKTDAGTDRQMRDMRNTNQRTGCKHQEKQRDNQ